jgi:hypothetical protein
MLTLKTIYYHQQFHRSVDGAADDSASVSPVSDYSEDVDRYYLVHNDVVGERCG